MGSGSAIQTPTFQAKEANITNAGGVSIATRPTLTKITSTTEVTYTVPAGVQWLKIKMVGGGGGGGGSGLTTAFGGAGAAGSTSFFKTSGGSTIVSCAGGAGGPGSSGQSAVDGGSATINSPAVGIGFDGGYASGSIVTVPGASYWPGTSDGVSVLGGAGGGSTNAAGANAKIYTGSGGGGSGPSLSTAAQPGAGGGAGAYAEFILTSLDATYKCTAGAGGTAGTANTGGYVGGAGATGIIIIEEYYS